MSADWPRLSETLEHGPGMQCWSCGAPAERVQLERWQECDESDQPTAVAIVLCRRCGARILDPHPRLYTQLEPMRPFPGVMPMCDGCAHRGRGTCTHVDLKANGGTGLVIRFAQPLVAHFCGGKRPRSGWVRIYHAWPTACAGRAVAALTPFNA